MKRFLVVALLIPIVLSLLIIKDIKSEENKAILNVTIDVYNNHIEGTVLNIEADLFCEIVKMVIYIKVSIPESAQDKEYKRVFIQTVLNVDKLVKGILSNPILKTVWDSMQNSMNFNTTFPLRKGHYKISNLTIEGKYYPFDTKMLTDIRVLGKIMGGKSMVFIAHYQCHSEVTH